MVAILNLYDSCTDNVQIKEGDYVVANTDEFGLKEGKKYKVLDINACDLITVEVYEGHTDIYSTDYFDGVNEL